MAARRAPRKGPSPASVLDAEHARFIEQGVSIVVASRDAEHTPTLARALGCHVASNLSRVTLYLWAPQCIALLASLRATGMLAAVFSEIDSHRTIQLKATDARTRRATRTDRQQLGRYQQAFTRSLATLGYDEPFARSLLSCEPGNLVAVAFTPTAMFAQTPGPNAGAAIA